jgi:hypothetical protein
MMEVAQPHIDCQHYSAARKVVFYCIFSALSELPHNRRFVRQPLAAVLSVVAPKPSALGGIGQYDEGLGRFQPSISVRACGGEVKVPDRREPFAGQQPRCEQFGKSLARH